MADKDPIPNPPEFSDADKARARQWFKKGADCRERREYDYAVECFVTGLAFWPEAVEEGHMPLRSISMQRAQAGGKKPGMMDTLKKPTSGKDAKQAMLNSEAHAAKDPANVGYLEALLKNAIKAGFLTTAKWAAPTTYEALKRDAKPDKAKFKAFRQILVEAADLAENWGQPALQHYFLEQAVQSLDFLLSRLPGEEDLKVEQRHLSGRLTITRGKYNEADSFRDSLRDAGAQKILHDTERTRQGDTTLDAVIASAKAAHEAEPANQNKFNHYVDALIKTEQPEHEQLAIAVLIKFFGETKNYSFKLKSDDVRLRQMLRKVRVLDEAAKASGDDDDKQQARLARGEYRDLVCDIFGDRVSNYPTDLRLRYNYGKALFEAGRFDEAIPALQAAQNEPRSRLRSRYYMGRAFFEKGNPAEAYEVLKEMLAGHDLQDDLTKEGLYWMGRTAEAAGLKEEAKAAYGKLLRMDYTYMDTRVRMDGLK